MAETNPADHCDETDNIERIERLVFHSRDLMAPTDQLRPQTLEVARNRFGQRKQARQLAWITGLAMLLWVVSLPAAQLIQDWRERLVAPLPDEVLQSADRYAAENPRQAAWGMVSVFTGLRTLKTAKPTTDATTASDLSGSSD